MRSLPTHAAFRQFLMAADLCQFAALKQHRQAPAALRIGRLESLHRRLTPRTGACRRALGPIPATRYLRYLLAASQRRSRLDRLRQGLVRQTREFRSRRLPLPSLTQRNLPMLFPRSASMKTLLLAAVLFTAVFAQAQEPNVAGRSEPVSVALEKQLNKKAAEITFADLEKVTELNLPHIHPKAKAFGDDDFAGLTNLKKLHMYSLFHNKGQPGAPIALNDKVFKDLSKLEELRIADDQLGQLPDDVFAGLTSLKVLDLSNITLNRLPNSLLNLPKIETVYYEGRGMSKEEFATMKSKLGDKLKGNRPK